MWKNGAIFETVLNRYTSAAFPAGVDPRHPASLQVFSSNGSASPLSNSSNAESLSALQDGFVNGSIAVAGSTSTTALPLDTA